MGLKRFRTIKQSSWSKMSSTSISAYGEFTRALVGELIKSKYRYWYKRDEDLHEIVDLACQKWYIFQ